MVLFTSILARRRPSDVASWWFVRLLCGARTSQIMLMSQQIYCDMKIYGCHIYEKGLRIMLNIWNSSSHCVHTCLLCLFHPDSIQSDLNELLLQDILRRVMELDSKKPRGFCYHSVPLLISSPKALRLIPKQPKKLKKQFIVLFFHEFNLKSITKTSGYEFCPLFWASETSGSTKYYEIHS